MARAVHEQIMKSDNDTYTTSQVHEDLADMVNFGVEVTLLPRGAFANYTYQRQLEGADLAHLKPPHINPSEKVISLLLTTKPEVKVEAERERTAVH
ncbi:unnamed protein product [marine sediment metagenome]|uniref:Uncharacterized protein n=1 Tax=marine sediment metagenome TaxID=412755 RepID=X1V171_9ZZZZ